MAKAKTSPIGDIKMEVKTIGLPVAEPPPGYRTNHLDLHLTQTQADHLAKLLSGLRKSNALLANGRYVNTPPDVIRWVLER
jgi:hypothetical protein